MHRRRAFDAWSVQTTFKAREPVDLNFTVDMKDGWGIEIRWGMYRDLMQFKGRWDGQIAGSSHMFEAEWRIWYFTQRRGCIGWIIFTVNNNHTGKVYRKDQRTYKVLFARIVKQFVCFYFFRPSQRLVEITIELLFESLDMKRGDVSGIQNEF